VPSIGHNTMTGINNNGLDDLLTFFTGSIINKRKQDDARGCKEKKNKGSFYHI
jgi:hypothetical protein